jgi:hypothetical protein
MLKNFINVQKKDVSLAGHCTVVPNNPKTPDPMIPPLPEFPALGCLFDCLGIIYL